LAEFSYDPSGANTFNKSDVNQDGVVDMNDAVVVDITTVRTTAIWAIRFQPLSRLRSLGRSFR